MENDQGSIQWFATRIIRERKYILKFLEIEGIEYSRIQDIRTLLFLHCTQEKVEYLRHELWDKVLFYKNAQRTKMQPIPDKVMESFLILAPHHDDPVFILSVNDPTFFEGERKRVIAGLFAGCEGVIKRIKGERRLIIKISDNAAVATPYIPRELLEDIVG